ncbi:MAG: TIGR01440 family protein [Symbiobacterium sp.]|uniref:TIGR01440 family protein n=1 Tax=Symbiobacterium sp. TaxID=1971213 RepID=UPI003463E4F5
MVDEQFLQTVRAQTRAAVDELLSAAGLSPGQVLVVGCSTSEILGKRIGTAGSEAVAEAVLEPLWEACSGAGVYLACQCCEHLNRALVVPAAAAERYGWERVWVVPVPQAGGAFAARAMRRLPDAVVVEEIAAHAGLDIGLTMIGMHLRRVAVPVRLQTAMIGQARVIAARTRPKLIGGARAVYEMESK